MIRPNKVSSLAGFVCNQRGVNDTTIPSNIAPENGYIIGIIVSLFSGAISVYRSVYLKALVMVEIQRNATWALAPLNLIFGKISTPNPPSLLKLHPLSFLKDVKPPSFQRCTHGVPPPWNLIYPKWRHSLKPKIQGFPRPLMVGYWPVSVGQVKHSSSHSLLNHLCILWGISKLSWEVWDFFM